MAEADQKDNTIGAMNGKWALMFKIWIGTLPVFVAWMAYMSVLMFTTVTRLAVIEGNRFTSSDALQMKIDMDERFDDLPPHWFKERMDKLERRLDAIEVIVNKLP